MRNVVQTKVAQKIKTLILCSILFFSENLAVFEIMWKNVLEPGRPQMTVFFVSVSRIFRFHKNLTRLTGTFHEDQCAFLITSP